MVAKKGAKKAAAGDSGAATAGTRHSDVTGGDLGRVERGPVV